VQYIFHKTTLKQNVAEKVLDKINYRNRKLFFMNFSVVINTYNAETYLRKVLDSVKEVDEIVICDMHSTDTTIAIAKEYNCKIVYFDESGENIGICEPARNLAIQSATNQWVLLLDADEIAPKSLLNYCNAHLQKVNPEEGIFIPRKNFLHGVFMHASYPDYIMRFFRKDACDWPPTMHSIPKIDGNTIKIPKKNKDRAIIHLDDQSIHERIEKLNRYASNDVKRMKQAGRRFSRTALLLRMTFFFVKFYLIKGGFRDGKMGLVYSLLHSFYRFIAIAKVWEQEITNNQNL